MTTPSVSFLNEITETQSTAGDRKNNACITITSPGLVAGSPSTVTVHLINISTVDAASCQVMFYWKSSLVVNKNAPPQPVTPNFVGQTNPTPGNSVTTTSAPVCFTMKWVPQNPDSGVLYAQVLIDPQSGCLQGEPPTPPGADPTDYTQVYNALYTTYIA